MKLNLPVTQQEYELPDGETLVSTTDTTGRITHCNQAFVLASGYDYAELLGQPHDIVRHPDVPPEAFKDLWSTIGRGRPWSGIVKNRRKNGDHYWVCANVTPVMDGGKPKAYMSVRLKPTREQIAAAEALYAQVAAQRQSGRATFCLHAGNLRPVGWRNALGKLHRLTLTQRASIALGLALALTLLPAMLLPGYEPRTVQLLQLLSGLMGAGAYMAWFVQTVTRPLEKAKQLAGEVAGCNLDGQITYDTTSPLASLMRRLWLINLNMRAIVADVRAEVVGVTQATQAIHQGSIELAGRTDSQASGVEQTSTSSEQIAGTVKQTADTVQELSSLSSSASTQATQGGAAVDRVAQSMHRIQSSSERITEIITVIEKLAFQTNLLALNAAVEASHAGEHGRGFGVVAGEVRALARRSSDAALQIRELIQRSAQEVMEGTQTVTSAAATIRTAVESVQRVTTRLNEITHATQEQSLGVLQISQSMQLLDGVTQQNAELVRQSTTACEVLVARSNTLQRAVKVFTMKAHPA